MRKISCIIKEPGKKPRHVAISDSDGNIKRIIGREYVFDRIFTDVGIIHAFDMRGLDWNCVIFNCKFSGTIIIVGVEKRQPAPLRISWDEAKDLMPDVFEAYDEQG